MFLFNVKFVQIRTALLNVRRTIVSKRALPLKFTVPLSVIKSTFKRMKLLVLETLSTAV